MRILGYILLFTICAFIDPAPGDIVKCRDCKIWGTAGPCDPPNECEINTETHMCSLIKVIKDGQVALIEQACRAKEELDCDETQEFGWANVISEYKCCYTDFCNDVIN